MKPNINDLSDRLAFDPDDRLTAREQWVAFYRTYRTLTKYPDPHFFCQAQSLLAVLLHGHGRYQRFLLLCNGTGDKLEVNRMLPAYLRRAMVLKCPVDEIIFPEPARKEPICRP
jgi:hypothetical protein